MSKTAGSKVVEVKGSHAIYVSQPQAVASLIEEAATAKAWQLNRLCRNVSLGRSNTLFRKPTACDVARVGAAFASAFSNTKS